LFHFGPTAACRFSEGDVGTGLFDLRFEEMTAADFEGFVFPGGKPHSGPRPARSEAGRWTLVATHRSGSVDVVVASARRRNFVVVGGILALLAASAVLVVRSAQRARHMASRQLEFVATVSHELRTPLAVICSAGENLADGLVTDAATVREYGSVVRDEGRRLAGMVERVLDFAGNYSGKRLLHLEPMELRPFLEECEAAVSHAISEAGVTLEGRYADVLPRVKADRQALRRVVVNLLENAAKHGAAGGLVRLEAGVDEAAPGNVRIAVVDRGVGVPADEIGAVFEPFFRGRDAVRRQLPGSGLGLSLVDRIVKAHGGKVSVASVSGGETSFCVTLPAFSGEKE
jgi:signal transduction histidine kinase